MAAGAIEEPPLCPQCKRSHWIVTREDRDRLLVENMDIVRRVAGKIHRNLPSSIELDDLISFGTFGLMRAIEHYDPTSGVHFPTYAISAIRGVIADELRSQDWAPRSLRKKQREVQRATQELERELRRDPTLDEIGEKLGISPRDVERTIHAAEISKHRSLDERHATDEDDTSSYDRIPDGDLTPEEQQAQGAIYGAITNVISQMPVQDQLIVTLYYYESLTLAEIGEVLGVPESRVSQTHVRAMLTVRNSLIGDLRA